MQDRCKTDARQMQDDYLDADRNILFLFYYYYYCTTGSTQVTFTDDSTVRGTVRGV